VTAIAKPSDDQDMIRSVRYTGQAPSATLCAQYAGCVSRFRIDLNDEGWICLSGFRYLERPVRVFQIAIIVEIYLA